MNDKTDYKLITNIIYIFGALFIVNLMMDQFKVRENKMNMSDVAKTGQEACAKISERAAEILKPPPEPDRGFFGDFVNNVTSFMNPKNYKSGENISFNVNNTQVNTDCSTDEVTKVQSSCSNAASVLQQNIITGPTPECYKMCMDGGGTSKTCGSIQNIVQENVSKIQQECELESVVNLLMTKTNSVDAQALAEAIQKAKGALSGDNKSANVNCQNVNVDMSSEKYTEAISKCANEATLKQENIIGGGCSMNVANVVQKNMSDMRSECIIGSTVTSENKIESDIKTKAESSSDQTTEGPFASSASLASLGTLGMIIPIVIFLCICLSSIMSAFMAMSGGGGESGSGGGMTMMMPPMMSQMMPGGKRMQ
jgi:hypothetical protein